MKPKIVVVCDGGAVQCVCTNDVDLDIVVVDYDRTIDRLVPIPQEGTGTPAMAHAYIDTAVLSRDWVEDVHQAVNLFVRGIE